MAMGVVESACEFSPDISRGVVVVESDAEQGEFSRAFDELNSLDARNMAIGYAAVRGMGSARINGNLIGPYPVNSEGLPLDSVRDEKGQSLPQTHPRMQPARYRLAVPVCRPIG